MKIKCIANTGENLSESCLALGNSTRTRFELKIGEISIVYGMALWTGVLHYLIKPEKCSYPSWFPSEIFEVIDHLLPIEWYFNFYPNSDVNDALWGYKELVQEKNHYVDLIERYNDAIEIFLRRKKEIDEFS